MLREFAGGSVHSGTNCLTSLHVNGDKTRVATETLSGRSSGQSPTGSQRSSMSSSLSYLDSRSCPLNAADQFEQLTAEVEDISPRDLMTSVENDTKSLEGDGKSVTGETETGTEVRQKDMVGCSDTDKESSPAEYDRTFNDESIEFTCNLTFDMMELGANDDDVTVSMSRHYT